MFRKLIPAFAGLIFALQVQAADCTWSAAGTTAERSVIGTGAIGCTFSTADQGMDASGISGFWVSVCAAPGQTITGVISLLAWERDPYSGVWMRAPIWDLPNANGTTGGQCQYVDGFSIPSPRGRIGYSPSAGTVSSGAIYFRMIAVGRGPYDGGDLL